MGKKLNIQPQTIAIGTVTNLLNGALSSLNGPIGFTPTQPRIHVKHIQVVNPSTTTPVEFSIFKGASGASAAGTQVISGNAGILSTLDYEVDMVLESTDFLTGTGISSGSVVINISAEIGF